MPDGLLGVSALAWPPHPPEVPACRTVSTVFGAGIPRMGVGYPSEESASDEGVGDDPPIT